MEPKQWEDLLQRRAVDRRIIDLVVHVARRRVVAPPTTETKQLLIAVEPDGYAAGRVGVSVLSLFFDPARARRIGEGHGFTVGPRSEATWIVRISADDLAADSRRDVAIELLDEALDRIEPLGPWNRGLPDAKKSHGGMCQIHFVQRSLTGACSECD
jgi:hypothetical protein